MAFQGILPRVQIRRRNCSVFPVRKSRRPIMELIFRYSIRPDLGKKCFMNYTMIAMELFELERALICVIGNVSSDCWKLWYNCEIDRFIVISSEMDPRSKRSNERQMSLQ